MTHMKYARSAARPSHVGPYFGCSAILTSRCLNVGVRGGLGLTYAETHVLRSYYAEYYSGTSLRHTMHKTERFARHALRAMPDLNESKPLRILDFGGGDGSLAVAIARLLQAKEIRSRFH